ncbi:maleylpyruvate isomerase family mycothiol-dependent enzyme [Streptomyces sp. GLT-R25]
MTERADRIIDALRSGHDYLTTVVHGLAAADLDRPSGASEWTVAQVLSHLGSGAEIGLAALEGALSGTGPKDMDFNKSVWARWDAMPPAEQAEGFVASNEALVRAYEDLDAQTRQDLRIDLGFLPAPVDVATAASMRLSEFANHSWDVEVAFDRTVGLARAATEPLLDQVGMLIGFVGKADALGGRHVRVAVRTTSPERSFGLDLGDAVALTDEPAEPDAVLSTPAEWWLRLVTGRHAPANTPKGVTLTGDGLTLDDLSQGVSRLLAGTYAKEGEGLWCAGTPPHTTAPHCLATATSDYGCYGFSVPCPSVAGTGDTGGAGSRSCSCVYRWAQAVRAMASETASARGREDSLSRRRALSVSVTSMPRRSPQAEFLLISPACCRQAT